MGYTTYGAIERQGLYIVLCFTAQVKDMGILERFHFPPFLVAYSKPELRNFQAKILD